MSELPGPEVGSCPGWAGQGTTTVRATVEADSGELYVAEQRAEREPEAG